MHVQLFDRRKVLRTRGAAQFGRLARVLGPVQVEEELQPERHGAEFALQPSRRPLLVVGLRLRDTHLAVLFVQLKVFGVGGALGETFAANGARVRFLALIYSIESFITLLFKLID